MTQASTVELICPRCGRPVAAGKLVCPACGLLTHVVRLQELSRQAQQLESTDPAAAIALWRQCLELLPPDSPQYQMVLDRLNWLAGGGQAAQRQPQYRQRPQETWLSAVAKTGGSMLLSILVYTWYFGDRSRGGLPLAFSFAIGFTFLMLIHEMGHVIAMRRYGIKGSPPIFIPFMGAVINLRGSPRNAREEAVIGMGGPLLGTVGAILCYGLAWLFRDPVVHGLLVQLSFYGFFLNLFNLLPVPPMDGGRITAGVSPWIWIPGIIALGGLFVMLVISSVLQGGNPASIFVVGLMLFYAAPRVWKTLASGARRGPYYQIGRAATWSIGTVYVLLGLTLIGLFLATLRQLPH